MRALALLTGLVVALAPALGAASGLEQPPGSYNVSDVSIELSRPDHMGCRLLIEISGGGAGRWSCSGRCAAADTVSFDVSSEEFRSLLAAFYEEDFFKTGDWSSPMVPSFGDSGRVSVRIGIMDSPRESVAITIGEYHKALPRAPDSWPWGASAPVVGELADRIYGLALRHVRQDAGQKE
jgi:hypothetical protein